MRIFFSVGEPSGDQHTAHLIKEIKQQQPDIEFTGFGGPLMERAGCRLDFQLTNLAVMGFFRVLPMIFQFYQLVKQAEQIFKTDRPDAVILVDFPGFNWWIARKAKAVGIPVFYYLPPQIWAWASYRVKRMQKFVDHVLCALPFEQKWYAERNVDAQFVGHPFFEEVAETELDEEFCNLVRKHGKKVVGVLPGSRNGEVTQNWPVMVEVIRRLAREHNEITFLVACYRQQHRTFCVDYLRQMNVDLPIEFSVGKTPEIIELAECCLMVSGSVSLELLARNTPAVVVYRVSRMTYWIAKTLVKCKYISLPNLIADRELLPEFPGATNPAYDIEVMTGILNGWLSDPELLALSRQHMQESLSDVVKENATAEAANYIVNHLTDAPRPLKKAA